MLLRTLECKPIRGINDMQPDGKGGLYFGTADVAEADYDGERSPSALYHLDRNGNVRRLADGFIFVNGIGLSPDRKHLYFSDTFVGVHGHEILPNGDLGPKMFQTEVPGADGLAVDSEGGIWTACIQSGTIVRLFPDGTVNQRIPLASEGVTSLCFGGSDLRDIYVTTAAPGFGEALAKKTLPARTASLYRGRSPVAGLPSGQTSFNLGG
jgi:sugar lactone lactonase YvrE